MRLPLSRVVPTLLGLATFVAVGLTPVVLRAQTPYVPYFGKLRPHYDKFDWHIYKTDHFEIYFYPELEKHLERVSAYAESAYQHISSELKHDMPNKIPMILFKTESEFQENNVSGPLDPGVLAFTEPERGRMVLPIDMPAEQLYELMTHEMTHAFMFDIVPRGIIGSDLPLWVDEGLADYMAGAWNPTDLMTVRDAAVTDSVPKMSKLEEQPITSGREPYELGHAAFEFIESKWGKDGMRQFLFSLRKSVLGSGQTAYEEALKLRPDEFDEQFDRYLKERFKPFRDKERPGDYGRNLAPDPDKTPFVAVASIEPSPSGDLIAAMAGNRHDYELDVILLSTRDGSVVRNLTSGLDKDRGFEYIAPAGGLRGNLVPWFAWAPVGDHIAYFARTEKEDTLIVENVVTGHTDQRIDLKVVDAPESPTFSPDGKTIVFSALSGGVSDLFSLDLASEKITNLTNDPVADYAPSYSPDGTKIVYVVHAGGNDKLYELDLTSGTKKQLTFGTHDDTCPRFYDDHTIVFTSTATDPNVTIAPEVAKNGDVPNVWTLDLQTNELKQWTDTVTANVSPIVLRQATGPAKVAFVTYYKGQYGVHEIALTGKPIATAQTSDFGAPGPVIDFQPPISQPLMPDNIHKKGSWEKMSLQGRPPIGLGVTSGGNFYGNTQITFADVLGDKQVSFYAQSVAQFRTTALQYTNIEHRFQYSLQAFSDDEFYYGSNAALFDPSVAPIIAADPQALAQFESSQRGGTAYLIYPFNQYRRVELFGGYIHLSESYTDPTVQASFLASEQQSGINFLANGSMLPLGVSFVQETTVYRDFGPIAGTALRLTYSSAPPITSSWVSRETVDGDARYYMRIGANGVLAFRLRGLKSWGPDPTYLAFGGNSEMRGYPYLSFVGQKAFFADVELRVPLIEAMLTPLGVLGGLRGTLFFDMGAAALNGQPFTFAATKTETYTPIIGYTQDALGNLTPVNGAPQQISGFRLVDGNASYGFGLESFLLGFPMHFDFSWKTLFNQGWEDALFTSQAAAAGIAPGTNGLSPGHLFFRKMQFGFWIGYDF
jgi:WD40 repeat protein